MAIALWANPSPQLLLVPKVQEKLNERGDYLDSSFWEKVKKFVDEYLWLAARLTTENMLV